ncbi:MAG: cytochrome b561 [Alphaproteobacteria bacterium]|jgi:cytochrome b561
MAVLIISMLLIGLSMVGSLAVWQPVAINLHKSFGVLLLLMIIIRLINTFITPRPKLPKKLSNLQVMAGKLTHFGLYAAMLLMPLSGWLMQSADGRAITVFSTFTLPHLIDANIKAYAFFREFHAWMAWLLIVMIVTHVLAALYHGLFRQDRVLASMLYSKKPK